MRERERRVRRGWAWLKRRLGLEQAVERRYVGRRYDDLRGIVGECSGFKAINLPEAKEEKKETGR
jgi:hypothetical protein